MEQWIPTKFNMNNTNRCHIIRCTFTVINTKRSLGLAFSAHSIQAEIQTKIDAEVETERHTEIQRLIQRDRDLIALLANRYELEVCVRELQISEIVHRSS